MKHALLVIQESSRIPVGQNIRILWQLAPARSEVCRPLTIGQSPATLRATWHSLRYWPAIVAELPDAVGEQRVSARIALGQAKQGRGGNERDAVLAFAIKSSNHGDAVPARRYEPMFRHLNARLCRESQRKNFTPRNVPCVIGLWKLRHCEAPVRQTHSRFRTRPPPSGEPAPSRNRKSWAVSLSL